MSFDWESLERLVPDHVGNGETTGRETLRLHVERYEFAARHLQPGRTLDIACGVGYGTRLLCDLAAVAVEGLGVDICAEAVAYAKNRYASNTTSFLCADGMTFSDQAGFQNIVSIETIEHLPNPRGFIAHLVSLLHPDGVLIASVPITPSVDANPHHLCDFTSSSFRRLFSEHGLNEIDALEQRQRYSLGSIVRRREKRMRRLRSKLPAFYFTHPGSLIRRTVATLRHGFNNIYLTVAWKRDG